MSDINPEMSQNAVSLYGSSDAMDDFPVLKAFQQYIDAEQAKARKRLVTMGTFFGVLMLVIIAVFVALLMQVSARNQSLNDRLVEYAMQDRRGSAPVVVQPAPQPVQDTGALKALNEKIDGLQRQLREAKATAQTIAQPVPQQMPVVATHPSQSASSAQDREIEKLKLLLAKEKERVALEKEKQHQAEIELYRRKHYPELYATGVSNASRKKAPRKSIMEDIEDEEQDVGDDALNDDDAISYFDDANDEDDEASDQKSKKRSVKTKTKSEKKYSIPVEIKGSSTSWRLPND